MKKLLIITGMLISLGSCKKLDNLLVNPNFPDPSTANVDLYFTQVQLSFAGFFNNASNNGMEVTRMFIMAGPNYQNAYGPTAFDGLWSTAYTGVFKHANEMIALGTTQKKFVQVGITKILKAYTMMTLVDMFGDVPYTEANLGSGNTNPKADKGADVYTKAIALLDEAIVDLARVGPAGYPGAQDLFYATSNAAGTANWRRVAKTLKLRAYMNIRLVTPSAAAQIQTLLTENDLINTKAQDFEFKYGSKLANPNTRHPRYSGNYTANGNAGDYIGTHFLWTVSTERGSGANSDPRLRYYFYRQVTNNAQVSPNSASCSVETRPAHYTNGATNPYTGTTYDMPFCLVANGTSGLWGRDHGDNSGIPPDGNLRTTVGVYPFGGEIDEAQATRVSLDRGARGAGIQPIWQSAFTDFLRAEAAVAGIVAADPKVALEAGMRKSIDKVITFPATVSVTVAPATVPTQARIDGLVSRVLNAYDLAANIGERYDVVMKEYYIALWGNGIDAYNMYRRTGKPGNFQFTKIANPGTFIRSFLYPSVYVNLNLNASQKPGTGVETPVFWDNNPATLFR